MHVMLMTQHSHGEILNEVNGADAQNASEAKCKEDKTHDHQRWAS